MAKTNTETQAAETPTEAGKPGRKPKPDYVPMDFGAPIAAVVSQTKTGPKVELYGDPTTAATAAMALAEKGIETITFGPQVQRFKPAAVSVTNFAIPSAPSGDAAPAAAQAYGDAAPGGIPPASAA